MISFRLIWKMINKQNIDHMENREFLVIDIFGLSVKSIVFLDYLFMEVFYQIFKKINICIHI